MKGSFFIYLPKFVFTEADIVGYCVVYSFLLAMAFQHRYEIEVFLKELILGIRSNDSIAKGAGLIKNKMANLSVLFAFNMLYFNVIMFFI
ncbi:MAG: hypothetical protein K0S24_1347 [Sphingobacterium sp.]|nr:hypothetical protein [Sphingobacterium sp.]